MLDGAKKAVRVETVNTLRTYSLFRYGIRALTAISKTIALNEKVLFRIGINGIERVSTLYESILKSYWSICQAIYESFLI